MTVQQLKIIEPLGMKMGFPCGSAGKGVGSIHSQETKVLNATQYGKKKEKENHCNGTNSLVSKGK